jgi:Protein of unknown function (DUF935)
VADRGVRSTLRDVVDALLGVSAYQPPGKGFGPQIDDASVDKTREAIGGNIQPLPTTRLRWYLDDLEDAQAAADSGYIRPAALLYRAMRRDGVLSGLLSARTSSLVRLPKKFYGNEEIADELRSQNGTRSVFDEMFPPSELAMLATDGIVLGIGVAELIPVPGRSYPVMVRLEPEFLQYRWAENRWYFNSIAGALPITPGDGRWILHVPGGRLTPWVSGAWPSLGRSFINKEHAILHRSNYSAKLANPARAAIAPIGASEIQRQGFFQKLLAWGTNTTFELPVGWDVKLIESNGRGWDVFQKEIDTCDQEYMVALTGQIVTTTGGAGFSNADIHKAIRQDMVQDTADSLGYTINTQGLPQYIVANYGIEALDNITTVEWDTMTPVDREKETRVLTQAATAIQLLGTSLAPYTKGINVDEIAVRYGIPLNDQPIAVTPTESESGVSKDGLGNKPKAPESSSRQEDGTDNRVKTPKTPKTQEEDDSDD